MSDGSFRAVAQGLSNGLGEALHAWRDGVAVSWREMDQRPHALAAQLDNMLTAFEEQWRATVSRYDAQAEQDKLYAMEQHVLGLIGGL